MSYEIRDSYRDDNILRQSFFNFTRQIFPSVGFEDWHRRGFWRDDYTPFSVIEDGQVVSNVSATAMTVLLDDKPVKAAQFGTVGTLPHCRGRGYSKILMEHVLEQYESVVDLIFLFANETVLNFYPKFGFKSAEEVIYKSTSGIPRGVYEARQLDINRDPDFALITALIQSRHDLTRIFGARNYGFITAWHLLNIFPTNIYYLPDSDVVIIATVENRCLHVWDVIFRKTFDLVSVLPKILKSDAMQSIVYHFPPDMLDFAYDEVAIDADSGLFVRGAFDIADRQFKYPVTAQT